MESGVLLLRCFEYSNSCKTPVLQVSVGDEPLEGARLRVVMVGLAIGMQQGICCLIETASAYWRLMV